MTLDELAIKYNTDKSSVYHNYTPIYQSLFEGVKEDIKNVFEIGISEGFSLRMWCDYFPNANIYGIDLVPYKEEQNGKLDDRMKWIVCNQKNKDDLIALMEEIGDKMDVFIDDGSHHIHDMLASLDALFPFLKRGGLYIMEDIQHPPDFEEYLKGYNYWVASAICRKDWDNSNLIVIVK